MALPIPSYKGLAFKKNERMTWAHPMEKTSHVQVRKTLTWSPLSPPEISNTEKERKATAKKFSRQESMSQVFGIQPNGLV